MRIPCPPLISLRIHFLNRLITHYTTPPRLHISRDILTYSVNQSIDSTHSQKQSKKGKQKAKSKKEKSALPPHRHSSILLPRYCLPMLSHAIPSPPLLPPSSIYLYLYSTSTYGCTAASAPASASASPSICTHNCAETRSKKGVIDRQLITVRGSSGAQGAMKAKAKNKERERR